MQSGSSNAAYGLLVSDSVSECGIVFYPQCRQLSRRRSLAAAAGKSVLPSTAREISNSKFDIRIVSHSK